MQRRRFIQRATAMTVALGLPMGRALAQATGPIKLWVGFPPGGAGDLFARILGDALREELGRPVVIENKPGGGGMTVAQGFLRAPKDGSTLMLATGSTAVSAPISRKELPYHPVEDFAWIALLSNAPFVIAINPQIPATDLKSFIAYCKTRPHELSYGHAGLGTTVHLAAELFKERAGIDVVDIPFPGSAGAITATMAGTTAFVVETSGTLLQHHKSGKLRILATFADAREKVTPDIPTSREAAGIDVVAGTYNLLAAPLGTPAEIVDPIARAVAKAMALPAMQQKLIDLGIQPIANSNPAQARAFVASEVARWTPVVRKLGIAL
jgi:tripartite-type tricarboxylate transporter receptor subunit TctC